MSILQVLLLAGITWLISRLGDAPKTNDATQNLDEDNPFDKDID